jgi:hypothetical protein
MQIAHKSAGQNIHIRIWRSALSLTSDLLDSLFIAGVFRIEWLNLLVGLTLGNGQVCK